MTRLHRDECDICRVCSVPTPYMCGCVFKCGFGKHINRLLGRRMAQRCRWLLMRLQIFELLVLRLVVQLF